MIISVSAKFADRLNCPVSFPERRPLSLAGLDSWSGDVFHSRAGQCALVMNDVTLSMVLIPLKGIRSFDQLLSLFLQRAARLFVEAGGAFEARNRTIVVLRRSDRSLIGTMNEAREHAHLEIEHSFHELDWDKVEDRLNELRFSLIDYHSAKEALSRALTARLY